MRYLGDSLFSLLALAALGAVTFTITAFAAAPTGTNIDTNTSTSTAADICQALKTSAQQNITQPPAGCWRTSIPENLQVKNEFDTQLLYRLNSVYKLYVNTMTSQKGLYANCLSQQKRLAALDAYRAQVQNNCQSSGITSAASAGSTITTGQNNSFSTGAQMQRSLQSQRSDCAAQLTAKTDEKNKTAADDNYPKIRNDGFNFAMKWSGDVAGPGERTANGIIQGGDRISDACRATATAYNKFLQQAQKSIRDLDDAATDGVNNTNSAARTFQAQSDSAGVKAAALEAKSVKMGK